MSLNIAGGLNRVSVESIREIAAGTIVLSLRQFGDGCRNQGHPD